MAYTRYNSSNSTWQGQKQLQQSTGKDSSNSNNQAGMTMISMTETSNNQLEEAHQCRQQGRDNGIIVLSWLWCGNGWCLVT